MVENVNQHALSEIDDEESVEEDNLDLKRCLSFVSGDILFFLSTEYVTEIINDHNITSLPGVPPYVRGVLNLRGSILPVVDIGVIMGHEETAYSQKTCIIVLNIDGMPVGIIVDSVRSVLDIDIKEVQALPLKNRHKLANGMLKLANGEIAMSFDCESLLKE